jgi:hypothetical protein
MCRQWYQVWMRDNQGTETFMVLCCELTHLILVYFKFDLYNVMFAYKSIMFLINNFF